MKESQSHYGFNQQPQAGYLEVMSSYRVNKIWLQIS